MTRCPQVLLLFIAALTVLAAAPASMAQRGLPQDIVAAPTLTDAQRGTVRRFVADQAAGLTGMPLEIKRSRNALLEPLRAPSISVGFRIDYGRELAGVVSPLVRHEREIVAVNALRLAGEVASPASLPLLGEGLGDPRPAVRYGATVGYQGLFSALRGPASPALTAQAVIAEVKALGTRLAREENVEVQDGLAQALAAAVRVSPTQVRGLRDEAVIALAQAMGSRVQAAAPGAAGDGLGGTPLSVFMRSGQALRDALTGGAEVSEAAAREAGGYGGDLLAYARRSARWDGADEAERAAQTAARAALEPVVALSETLVSFSQSRLGGRASPLDLRTALQNGRDAFQQKTDQVIGPAGVLVKPPFGLAGDRFRR